MRMLFRTTMYITIGSMHEEQNSLPGATSLPQASGSPTLYPIILEHLTLSPNSFP